MKRSMFFFIFFIMSLQVLEVFAHQEMASKEEIDQVARDARKTIDNLKQAQQKIEQGITRQEEVVKQASDETQRNTESDKLDNLKVYGQWAEEKIATLNEYLDTLNMRGSHISQQYLDGKKDAIKFADNIINEASKILKSEFVPSEPPETGQAQAQIEKLGLWDTFKLNIQSVFAQTKATLANFFGNKKAVAAAHEDLIAIYDQLKDYNSKAQSIDKLAELYTELEDFGNAIAVQTKRLDVLTDIGISQNEKVSAVSDIIADLLSLRNRVNAANLKLKFQDRKDMLDNTFNIEAKINDFLGELGYRINKISAYEELNVAPTDEVDEIKEQYDLLTSFYNEFLQLGEARGDSPAAQQVLKTKLEQLNNAIKELLGPDINSPNLAIKEAYDKSSIVKQGFEIKKMTDQEIEAFQQKKAQKASQKQTEQTDILDE